MLISADSLRGYVAIILVRQGHRLGRRYGYFVFLDFLIRRNIRALSAKLILMFDRTYLFVLVSNICIW